MESFSNSKGPQSITKKLEDPKGITKGNIDVAAWTHKFSLATRYQRLNCFFGAAIDMSKVKSWTSEPPVFQILVEYLVICPVQTGAILLIIHVIFRADYKNNFLIAWKTLTDKLYVLPKNA